MSAPKRYMFTTDGKNLRQYADLQSIENVSDYSYWTKVVSGAGVETICLSTTPVSMITEMLKLTLELSIKDGSCADRVIEHTITTGYSAPSVRNDTPNTRPATNVCHKRGKTRLSHGRLE